LPQHISDGLYQYFNPTVREFINLDSAQGLLQNLNLYKINLIFIYNLLPDLKECHELCIALRAKPDLETVPIVVVSHQQNSHEEKIKMLKSGLIDGYVSYSISSEELMAYADVFLQRFSLEQELEKKNELLNQLSITDELTKLFNRRYLIFALDQELKKSLRYGYDFSCVMIDIDNFKQINDLYGHAAGDIALKKLSEMVKESIRSIDIACRYGGEEMVIILPHTNSEGVYIVAERLRQKVQECIFAYMEKTFGFTISAGFLTLAKDDSATVDIVFQKLDQQLYKAKNSGKNKICGGLFSMLTK
jgi:diguanylate cyclase (GGDEF)-like protein